MTETREIKRFRSNPIEIVILMVVTGIFCHSVYQLFYDSENFNPAALQPMAADPISESPREPASSADGTLSNTFEVQCGRNMEVGTIASRVRLSGPLCGADAVDPGSDLTQAQVLDTTNQFSATVSTDVDAARFTTDFIPLSPGRNVIQIELTYRSGKVVTQELGITRN